MSIAEHPLGANFFKDEPEAEGPRLAPDAMIGLAGRFVRQTLPQTEADAVGLLISFLNAASVLFQGTYGEACGRRHSPTDFDILVGRSGEARKGTATAHALSVVKLAYPDFETLHVIRGLASGEGLVQKMKDRSEKMIVADRRFLVVLTEFGQLLEVMTRTGNTLSYCIRQAWDGDPLHVTTRKDSLEIADFQLSILGNITGSELLDKLCKIEYSNGFANRFQYFFVKRSQFLPEGGDHIDYSEIAAELRRAVANASGRGRMERSPEAKELWAAHYERLSSHPENLRGSLCSRAEAHTLRKSVLYALLDDTRQVEEHHLRAALALTAYSEASIGEIFGDRLGDADAEKICEALMANGPMSMSDFIHLFGRNKSAEWLKAKLAAMEKEGLIVPTTKEGDRKTIPAWKLKGRKS